MEMIRVPNSAIEWGNLEPGQAMNINDVDIWSRCDNAMTLDGSKGALTIILDDNTIIIPERSILITHKVYCNLRECFIKNYSEINVDQ